MKPSKEIRKFKGSDYVGTVCTIECGHVSAKDDDQYVNVRFPGVKRNDWDHPLSGIGGWAGKVLGKEGSKVRRKVVNVELIEHCNGGRSDATRYPSYRSFFNKKRKELVLEFWGSTLEQCIMGVAPLDADRADLIVTFGDFEIESMCFDFTAPEEWYSEMMGSDPRFKFKRGFYESAEEAIKFFMDKPVDDMFGERYFPVIVFPHRKLEIARSIAEYAKNFSKPLVIGEHAIFGTRCKPSEYREVIRHTYENGGQVARSMEWNW